MLVDIPFYINNKQGNQCLQVTMKTVIKHFLNKDISLEELDKLTGRKDHFWTYTTQAITVLHDLGLKLKYYSIEEFEPLLEGEPYIKKHFGKNAERILKFTDLPVLIKSIKKSLELDIFEKKALKLDDLEEYLEKGAISIINIDYNYIKEGLFVGHYVIITGFDNDHIYFHNSGPDNPTPNQKVKKDILLKAWDAAERDVIVVFGKEE